MPTALTRTSDHNEAIAGIQDLGLEMDDDHEPAPKNIHNATTTYAIDNISGLYQKQSWG